VHGKKKRLHTSFLQYKEESSSLPHEICFEHIYVPKKAADKGDESVCPTLRCDFLLATKGPLQPQNEFALTSFAAGGGGGGEGGGRYRQPLSAKQLF
jgi:hypothetical protein